MSGLRACHYSPGLAGHREVLVGAGASWGQCPPDLGMKGLVLGQAGPGGSAAGQLDTRAAAALKSQLPGPGQGLLYCLFWSCQGNQALPTRAQLHTCLTGEGRGL